MGIFRGQQVNSAPDQSRVEEISPLATIETEHWRSIHLTLRLHDGPIVDIQLLRPIEWLDSHVDVHNSICDLAIPEMNIAGRATVVAIEPCPPLEILAPGAQYVTGRFETSFATVVELQIDGQAEPIIATASHPFWSLDRGEWVAVGKLRPGERLGTLDGHATVSRVGLATGCERVYNLEVRGDHTYFVSDARLWVHNACARISDKIRRQMPRRGWTEASIGEAIAGGQQVRAVNKANGNPATRYIHPRNGQSMVVDDVTGEIIHVGGPGFKYGPGAGDLP